MRSKNVAGKLTISDAGKPYSSVREWCSHQGRLQPTPLRGLVSGRGWVNVRRLESRRISGKSRLERTFEADVVRELKAGATRHVRIGGPALAAHAIRAGLVDEYHLLIAPVIAGSGNPYLPGKVRVKLELLDERRFDNGLVCVRYQAKS